MSESPESKDELMPLRRSTRKSVVSKVEEQVLTPKKRKSTSTPLKNVLEKGTDSAGTPRKTRGTATPRKSVADQVSSTPQKNVSNARSDESPKKKDVSTPRKSLVTHSLPANDSKETNKRTPRKSIAVETSPVITQRETNRRTPRKSIRSTKEIKKTDETNVYEQNSLSEEVAVSYRGKRKSVAASLLKRTSPSLSIKDSDSGIVSFDEDSQTTFEEQKLSPKKKSRKSVHFKKEVDELHLEQESEQSYSTSPKKTASSTLVSNEILKSSLALVPKVMLTDVKTIVREAESAESAIIDASYLDVNKSSSKFETKVPIEDSLDKVLLSPAKFLTSDEDGAEKEGNENLKIKVSEEKFSHISSPLQEMPKSEKLDKHKSPRRKLAYESHNVHETVTALNLEKKLVDTEAKVPNKADSNQTVNEIFQGNSPQKPKTSTFKQTESVVSIKQNKAKIEEEFPTSVKDNLPKETNSLSPDMKSVPVFNEHNSPVPNSLQCKIVKSPESCSVTTSENDLCINRATEISHNLVNSQLANTSCFVGESPVSSSEPCKFSDKSEHPETSKTSSEGDYQANNSYSVSSTGEIYEAELSLLEKGETCNSELNASEVSKINSTEKEAELLGCPKIIKNSSNLEEVRDSLDKSTALIKKVINASKSDNGLTVSEGNFNEIHLVNQIDIDQTGHVNKNAISSLSEEMYPSERQSENQVHVTSASDDTEPCDKISQSDFEPMNNSLHSISGKELEETTSSGDSATQIDLELSTKRMDHAGYYTEVSNNSFMKTDPALELKERPSKILKGESLGVLAYVEASEDNKVNKKCEEAINSDDSSRFKGDLNTSKSENEVNLNSVVIKLETNGMSSGLNDGNHNKNVCDNEEVGSRTSQSHSFKLDPPSKCETENKMEEVKPLTNNEIKCKLDYSNANENKSIKNPSSELNTIIKEDHEEKEAQNVCETSEIDTSVEFNKIEVGPTMSSAVSNEQSFITENNLIDQSKCFKLDLSNPAESNVQLNLENDEINKCAFSSKLPIEHDSSKFGEILSGRMEENSSLSPKGIKNSSRIVDLNSSLAEEKNSNNGEVDEISSKPLALFDDGYNSSIKSPKNKNTIEDVINESSSGTFDLNSTHAEEKNLNDGKLQFETSPKSLPLHGDDYNSSFRSPKNKSNIEDAINESSSGTVNLNSTRGEENNSNDGEFKVDETSPKSLPPHNDDSNSSFKSPKNMNSNEYVINESNSETHHLDSTHTEETLPLDDDCNSSFKSPSNKSSINESSSGTVDLNSIRVEEINSNDGKLKVNETSPKSLPLHNDDYNSSFKSPKNKISIEDVINESSSGTVNLNSTHAEENNSNDGELKVDETSLKSLLPPHNDDSNSSFKSPKNMNSNEYVINESSSETHHLDSTHTEETLPLDDDCNSSFKSPKNKSSINGSSPGTDLNSTHVEEKNSNDGKLKVDETSPKSLPLHNDDYNSSFKSSKNKISIEDVIHESSLGTVDHAEGETLNDGKVDETSSKSLLLHDDDFNSIKSPTKKTTIKDVINESSSQNVDPNSPHTVEKNLNGNKLKVDDTKSLPPSDDKNNSSINCPEKLRRSPSVSNEQLTSNALNVFDSERNDCVRNVFPTKKLLEKEEVISRKTQLGKISKKQQLFTKKPYSERNSASAESKQEILCDKDLSSGSEKNKSHPCPLGKRSLADIKNSKVTLEIKKKSKLSKNKESEHSEKIFSVSDFIDLEAAEGEESEMSNAYSCSEEAEESSNSTTSVASAFEFLDKEAKEHKKTCHVGTVDTLFNKTLSEDEEDTDWLPPKHVADNLDSISLSQKLRSNLARKFIPKKKKNLFEGKVISYIEDKSWHFFNYC